MPPEGSPRTLQPLGKTDISQDVVSCLVMHGCRRPLCLKRHQVRATIACGRDGAILKNEPPVCCILPVPRWLPSGVVDVLPAARPGFGGAWQTLGRVGESRFGSSLT